MELISKKELQQRYKVSQTTLWRIVNKKRIMTIYIKGDRRSYYDKKQIDKILNTDKQP